MRFIKGILLPALLLGLSPVYAKKDEPGVKRTEFQTEPSGLFYFDDTETVILIERERGVIWRSEDAGENWKTVSDIPEREPFAVIKNPYDNHVAVALGMQKRHWITYDQGKSWKSFETKGHPTMSMLPIQFHATDPKKLLFSGDDDCEFMAFCTGKTWYTEDGFDTLKPMRNNRKICIWAKSTDLFTTGDDKFDDKRVLCIVQGKFGSTKATDYRLVVSDDYFDNEHEPTMSDGRVVSGMTNMAPVKAWIVAAAKGEGTDELALYVTKDTIEWHQARFTDHKIEEDAYTILESTNYSIQVDVMTKKWTEMGSLFTSNSNGTYFTRNIEHTNRNRDGYVDFEKISNVQGVVMVNQVENYEQVEQSFAPKKVKSKISFDDGRTFDSLKVKDGGKELHVHSVTQLRNSGRVFSSPAPGLVMAIGNTGEYLDAYDKGDLYVSDDGGLTWVRALEDAHKFEFGDQGAVLVAVYDEGSAKDIRYSLKHGQGEWGTIKMEKEFFAGELTTIPDSTSLRFIMTAKEGRGSKGQYVTYALNFADMHESDCKDSDFEKWQARVDEKGDAICIMGRKQSYRRRKANADCFVNQEFKDPVPEFETCPCSATDYECDFDFVPKGEGKDKECVPARALSAPKDECKDPKASYKGPSGWRLIPGNQCDKNAKGAVVKDEKVERPCSDTKAPAVSGKISTKVNAFPATFFSEYYYLERNSKVSQDNDETIVMLTSERVAYMTHDHGKTWKKAVDDEVVAIYPHAYYNEAAFFVTPKRKVYYTYDRGDAINSFDAPEAPNKLGAQILSFHPKTGNKEWLIWTGEKDGRTVSHVSTNGGLEGSWKPLLPAVRKCQFIWREEGRHVDEKLVYCEQFGDEDMDHPLQLLSSEDWFQHRKVEFEDVVNFATMSEFIVIASKTEDRKFLKLDASIDGKTFADAKFPPKFTVEHQQAYTVLDSATHSVFLHVTVNPTLDQEYGSIIKSNSNGTSYVMSINYVNRDTDGYVDFEKMQGLEGVALVNVVSNFEAVNEGSKKQKKTMITHNDGAEWALLTPPEKDSDGKKYACTGQDIEKCALHLHSYTERSDPRNTFSSPTAVGLMMGVGNVGEYLGRIDDGNTYITKDGGVTWKEAMKGVYMWEFGDQGSIIVLVQRHIATDKVYYSLDEGDKWEVYQFSDSKMQIDQISTVPSDTSLNFLLWGKDSAQSSKIVTVNLDFSGLFSRECKLDDDDPEAGDYYLWSPKHPLSPDDCLFGHVALYHRKKPGTTDCYNGKRIDHHHDTKKQCECTRRDFECDYNYERQSDGSCGLVPGLEPADPMEACALDPKLDEYWDVTGYRKLKISTCSGGADFEKYNAMPHPCPNHEDAFKNKHRTSGFVIFLAVVLPFIAAGGIGYYVYNNWDGKFGRIRLGDASYTRLDGDSPWVKYPVMAVSGVVAVVAAIPMLIGALFRFATDRLGGGSYGRRTYTTRSSFARGRGDYAVVDPMDEGELLGEDSDEDV